LDIREFSQYIFPPTKILNSFQRFINTDLDSRSIEEIDATPQSGRAKKLSSFPVIIDSKPLNRTNGRPKGSYIDTTDNTTPAQ